MSRILLDFSSEELTGQTNKDDQVERQIFFKGGMVQVGNRKPIRKIDEIDLLSAIILHWKLRYWKLNLYI